MLKPRMIVVDMDRTLLKSDGSIAEASLAALSACKERGMRVVFATGRPLRKTPEIRAAFAWDGWCHHNGGIVEVGPQRIATHQIPIAQARSLAASLAAAFPDLPLTLETNDILYAERPLDLATELTVLPSFDETPNIDADKLILSMPTRSVYEQVLTMLPENLYAEICDDKLVLIMANGARKENGVSALAKAFGIAMADVLAFGDDFNDVGMVRACGYGVAMANATDAVKAAADHVCGHHDENGVAEFLYAHIID